MLFNNNNNNKLNLLLLITGLLSGTVFSLNLQIVNESKHTIPTPSSTLGSALPTGPTTTIPSVKPTGPTSSKPNPAPTPYKEIFQIGDAIEIYKVKLPRAQLRNNLNHNLIKDSDANEMVESVVTNTLTGGPTVTPTKSGLSSAPTTTPTSSRLSSVNSKPTPTPVNNVKRG